MSYTHYDSKTSIGFYSHVSMHPDATVMSGQMIRKYHPAAPILLSFDGNANMQNYVNVADQLNAEYMGNNETMGYPIQPYGYRREKILEWFNRLYIGFVKLNVSHVMMWEEDSIFLGPIEFDEEWNSAGNDGLPDHHNTFPQPLIRLIEDFNGKKLNTIHYSTSGCSIFKREPLLKHYYDIYKWLDGNVDYIQDHIYPYIGWMDCLMTVIYMLCGCETVINPQLGNIDPHNPIEANLSRQPIENVLNYYKDRPYKIIHNWKFHY